MKLYQSLRFLLYFRHNCYRSLTVKTIILHVKLNNGIIQKRLWKINVLFQCQETAKGIGCTVKGVCGKLPSTSKYMDLLLGVVRGVGAIDTALRKAKVERPQGVGAFIVDALFSTITNANFDDAAILRRVIKASY